MENTQKEKNSATEQSSSTEIVSRQNEIVNFNAESLIAQAIDKQVPVETMDRLLSMAKEMQAIYAKREFDKAMAKFQAECPVIEKRKEVKDNSAKVLYKYAPIDDIVQQVKEPLQNNGFSYSTGMKLLDTGVEVAIKVTHKDGHSEITYMTVPLSTKTGIMSASQQVAAAQTFAKRYAFLNAFGIMTGDEDNDGKTDIQEQPLSKPVLKPHGVAPKFETKPADKSKNKFEVYKLQINTSKDLKELTALGKTLAEDPDILESHKKDLRILYGARKDELELAILNKSLQFTNK